MNQKSKKKVRAIICNIIGKTILVVVILLCIPLILPKIFEYQVYNVISGSMEPEIPVGSLVFIDEIEAEKVQEGDVIAFYSASDSGAIIVHRVEKNQVVSGQFITKGDANDKADPVPIKYELLIGKVVMNIPVLGKILSAMVTIQGKIVVGGLVLFATILQLIAGKIKNSDLA